MKTTTRIISISPRSCGIDCKRGCTVHSGWMVNVRKGGSFSSILISNARKDRLTKMGVVVSDCRTEGYAYVTTKFFSCGAQEITSNGRFIAAARHPATCKTCRIDLLSR